MEMNGHLLDKFSLCESDRMYNTPEGFRGPENRTADGRSLRPHGMMARLLLTTSAAPQILNSIFWIALAPQEDRGKRKRLGSSMQGCLKRVVSMT